jgi:hypothetical protein
MRDIKFRGIKKETKESGFYGGYFSNTDEEGLEHFIFEVYNGTSLRPYNRAIQA